MVMQLTFIVERLRKLKHRGAHLVEIRLDNYGTKRTPFVTDEDSQDAGTGMIGKEFNREATWTVPDDFEDTGYLRITVIHQRTFRMDKRAAECHVKVASIPKLQEPRKFFAGWLNLEHKGVVGGQILVRGYYKAKKETLLTYLTYREASLPTGRSPYALENRPVFDGQQLRLGDDEERVEREELGEPRRRHTAPPRKPPERALSQREISAALHEDVDMETQRVLMEQFALAKRFSESQNPPRETNQQQQQSQQKTAAVSSSLSSSCSSSSGWSGDEVRGDSSSNEGQKQTQPISPHQFSNLLNLEESETKPCSPFEDFMGPTRRFSAPGGLNYDDDATESAIGAGSPTMGQKDQAEQRFVNNSRAAFPLGQEQLVQGYATGPSWPSVPLVPALNVQVLPSMTTSGSPSYSSWSPMANNKQTGGEDGTSATKATGKRETSSLNEVINKHGSGRERLRTASTGLETTEPGVRPTVSSREFSSCASVSSSAGGFDDIWSTVLTQEQNEQIGRTSTQQLQQQQQHRLQQQQFQQRHSGAQLASFASFVSP